MTSYLCPGCAYELSMSPNGHWYCRQPIARECLRRNRRRAPDNPSAATIARRRAAAQRKPSAKE